MELVAEVFADGFFEGRKVEVAPFAAVEGLVDLSLLEASPENVVELIEAGFENRVVKGKVGDETGLGSGFKQSGVLEASASGPLLLIQGVCPDLE